MTLDNLPPKIEILININLDIFQEVMAEQPALIKFLNNPLVGAALGVVASKWLRRQ